MILKLEHSFNFTSATSREIICHNSLQKLLIAYDVRCHNVKQYVDFIYTDKRDEYQKKIEVGRIKI